MSANQKPMFVTFLVILCLLLPSILFRQMFWMPLIVTIPYFVWVGLPVINKSIDKQTVRHLTNTCLGWIALNLVATSMDRLTEIFGNWNRFIIPLGPIITPLLIAMAIIVIFDIVFLKFQ